MIMIATKQQKKQRDQYKKAINKGTITDQQLVSYKNLLSSYAFIYPKTCIKPKLAKNSFANREVKQVRRKALSRIYYYTNQIKKSKNNFDKLQYATTVSFIEQFVEELEADYIFSNVTRGSVTKEKSSLMDAIDKAIEPVFDFEAVQNDISVLIDSVIRKNKFFSPFNSDKSCQSYMDADDIRQELWMASYSIYQKHRKNVKSFFAYLKTSFYRLIVDKQLKVLREKDIFRKLKKLGNTKSRKIEMAKCLLS